MHDSRFACRRNFTLQAVLICGGALLGLQVLLANVTRAQEIVTIPQSDSVREGVSLYGALRADAMRLSAASLGQPLAREQWLGSEVQRRQMWLEMLGLHPLPERTPLQPVVTGTLDRDDYVVEKIHFQSLPGAYVIGNLYRPSKIEGPLPTVLYLCGHSKGKVNPPYQANPRWFAQHGYVALVLDPIQLGESQGFHHGTYRDGRWDWQSRGYTPAGTEVWNAMRALDYLETRTDVDAERLGVTGLSGGGVISWCLGAADPRVKVVVPVCQSGSIGQVVTDRGTDGHCDCAFWINYYRWCWPDIGSLIAPRALLIASGSEDVLWRPNGYRDIAERIRRQYYQVGANELFDLVEDATPHGYTPKLRRAIFTWFNRHLKDDPTPVTDDVTDFVEPEENLLVFAGHLPADDKMTQVDRTLVQRNPLPDLDSPEYSNASRLLQYLAESKSRLIGTTFRTTVQPFAEPVDFRWDGTDGSGTYGTFEFSSQDGLRLAVKTTRPSGNTEPLPTLVFPLPEEASRTFLGGGASRPRLAPGLASAAVEVRNTGANSIGPGYLWTARRTLPLLGQSLPERQVADLLSAMGMLEKNQQVPIQSMALFGYSSMAPIAIYAGMLNPQVDEIVLQACPSTHEDPSVAEFLGVLRIGDLPHNLALAYPRAITFVGKVPDEFQWTKRVYEKLDAADRFRQIDSITQWRPFGSDTVR